MVPLVCIKSDQAVLRTAQLCLCPTQREDPHLSDFSLWTLLALLLVSFGGGLAAGVNFFSTDHNKNFFIVLPQKHLSGPTPPCFRRNRLRE
jgi:hypothetical protein